MKLVALLTLAHGIAFSVAKVGACCLPAFA